jgi:uncharacterized protein (TIGR03437 family)
MKSFVMLLLLSSAAAMGAVCSSAPEMPAYNLSGIPQHLDVGTVVYLGNGSSMHITYSATFGLSIRLNLPKGNAGFGAPVDLSRQDAIALLNSMCNGLGTILVGQGDLLRGPEPQPHASAAAVPFSLYGAGSGSDAFADLDGDGNPDLVQVKTNSSGGQITVQILSGAGLTTATYQYSVGSTTINDVVVADFNGDGHPDLAVADDGGGVAAGAIWILLGNGDGTFKPAVKTPAPAGPYHLFAADFNGDGKIDIATSNDQAPTVSVFFGKGDGTLQSPISLTGIQYPGSLVAADFYGNGRADIAVLDIFANTAVVFPANADGTFQAAQSYPAGYGPGFLLYADLNNDGIPDLAASYADANSTVFLINNAKGGFTTSPTYLSGAQPGAVGVLPLNGPIVLLSGDSITGNVLIQFGRGDGTLNAPQLVFAGTNPTAVATGDLNGDGKDDAVLLEPQANAAYVLLNSGNGKFASPVTVSVPTPNAAALVAMTKGGKPDLVVASGSGNVAILPNNGKGGLGAPLAFPAGTSTVALAIADFNGDGNADVATADSGSFTSAVSVLMGNGQGGLGAAITYLPSQSGSALAAADVNNDGHPDLIVATASPVGGGAQGYPLALTVLVNKGDGTFTALPPIYTIPATSQFNGIFKIVTGDFNGDEKMDLAVLQQNQVSQIQILLGNGDGTFRMGALLPTEFGANTAVAADINGDGIVDLIIGHCCGDTDDTYLLGKGDGTFQAEVDFAAGASPQGLALADWNGTGKADLAIAGQVLMGRPGTKGFFLPLTNSFPPTVLSGASFTTGALAPSEIVTLKGNLLASSTANAFPLPTTEGGATVMVTDSKGNSYAAPLYYVSPKQINFEVPADIALGAGSVSLTQSDGTNVITPVQFANSAPGIFQLNTATGLAAAQALVGGSYLPVYQVAASGSIVPLPIDLSQGQVYLILYGTGIRNATNVTVTVGGLSVPSAFAAQGFYAGEDQVNVGPLPASLAGKGSVSIVLTADGVAANTVNVTIK